MRNPVRNMYWGLRKKGVSDKRARKRVKEHFSGGEKKT
jgi:tRNA(His) 5'-end guanylyltransferase